MPALKTLSDVVREHPKVIDASLEKLTCTSYGVTDVDIHPAALATLTANASSSVKALVRDYESAVPAPPRDTSAEQQSIAVSTILSSCSSSSCTAAPLVKRGETARRVNDTQSAENYFNIALALSLHTVLLSRNALTSLVGVVQFKHVVRLSLLGNRIRRIEDCEPLSLLPQLAFLSLEFNPVCALPHYRAHLLRITSWPKELSLRSCRLRKLDAKTVSPHDVTHGISCLQREMSLLPELAQRQRLVSFLGHVEQTMHLHQEMRRRGILLHDTEAEVTLPLILERCSSAALEISDFATTAHATRLLVVEQLTQENRRQRRGNASGPSTANPKRSQTALKASKQNGGDPSVEVVVTQEEGACPTEVPTHAAASALDVSVETRTSESGRTVTSVLDDVSEICLDDLTWSKLSLSNAEQSHNDAVCEEWSSDRFRAVLSSLDIKICTYLLRTAKMLGQTLNSADVDDVCRMWMHILSHYEHASSAGVNVTGKRSKRPFVARVDKYAKSTVAGASPTLQYVEWCDEAKSPAAERVHAKTLHSAAAPVRPGPVGPNEAADSDSQVSSVVVLSGSADSCAGASFGSTVPCSQEAQRPQHQHHLQSVPARSPSVEAESRDRAPSPALSEITPRRTIPLAMALARDPVALRAEGSPVKTQRLGLVREKVATTFSPPSSTSPGIASAGVAERKDRGETGEAPLVDRSQEASVTLFLKKRELHTRKAIFSKLCLVFRRRKLQELCAQHRAEKVIACASDLSTLCSLNLLDGISYIPRKGVLFHHWREKSVAQLHSRAIRTLCMLRTWRRRTVEEQTCGVVHEAQCAHLKAAAFQRWKVRACQTVIDRCAAAKRRLTSSKEPEAAESASPPQSIAPKDAYALPFDLSPLKRALSGGPSQSQPPPPSAGDSSAGLSPIGNASNLSHAAERSDDSSEFHLSPPPSLDALRTIAQSVRASSRSSGAVVMSIATPSSSSQQRRRQSPAGAAQPGGRSSSTGLVRSPAAQSGSSAPTESSPAANSSPFSEDDVAALVERASALQSSREMLAQRVVGLQLECQQYRHLCSQAEADATDAKGKLKACQQLLMRSEAQKETVTKEMVHLKQCVATLRQERREWLEQVLTYSKRRETTVYFSS